MGQRFTSLNISYGTVDSVGRMEEEEQGIEEEDRLLYSEDGLEGPESESYGSPYSSSSSESDVQDGVRKIEAISKTWTQRSLIVAYLGYVLFLFLVYLSAALK